MNITIVIPTYWTSVQPEIQAKTPQAIYDHPTPLESQSTLPRLLQSLKDVDLPKGSTSIIVISTSTHKELERQAKRKVERIIKDHKHSFDITCLSASTFNRLVSANESLKELLALYGYSNVRNIGLVTTQINESDIALFLDDDVIVRDPEYLQKITQFIGKHYQGNLLGGIAGFYTDPIGNYWLDIEPKQWWKFGWLKEKTMNEAFKIIRSNQRLVSTTFAFGGNMAIHWQMFERVPFDPGITRGEDMDLLLNAKMFRFEFLLDTDLHVVHLPGEEKASWSEMRQDVYRFLYMREKIRAQKYIKNINPIPVDALKPYPGDFLTSGISARFFTSNCLHTVRSLLTRELQVSKEFVYNFACLFKAQRFAKTHAMDYFKFQKKWTSVVPKIRGDIELKRVLGNKG